MQAFSKEAIERGSDAGERMVAIVRQLQANPEVFAAVVGHLTQEQQLAIHTFLAPLAADSEKAAEASGSAAIPS